MLKITVTKQELSDTVTKLLPFCERKTTIPVLANFLVDASTSKTTITATDLDKTLVVEMPDAQVKGTGRCTVPAHKLAKTIANIKTIDNDTVTIVEQKDYWIELQCGEFKVKLPGMDSSAYPVIPLLNDGEKMGRTNYIDTRLLNAMIGRTAHAIATEESRYTLNGGLLVVEPDSVRLVTTDGQRLVNVSKNGTQYQVQARTLVKREVLVQLKRLTDKQRGDVQVAVNDTGDMQYFTLDNWTLVARALTGRFPNYNAVIPKTSSMNGRATVDPQTFIPVVKRVGMYSDERSGAMRVELIPAQGIGLSASCSDTGDASERFKCDCETVAAKVMVIGLDYRYLLEMLGSCPKGELLTIGVVDAGSAILCKPVNGEMEVEADYVLMPMRI